MDDRILLFWPTIIVHKVTPESPLYNLTPADLHPNNNSFEIIVVLEGIVESTGLTTQARSSYLPSEVGPLKYFRNMSQDFLVINYFGTRSCGGIGSSVWRHPSHPQARG